MSKIDFSKIVSKLKAQLPHKVEGPKLVAKPNHRERDMRQEAIDMGSHGAQDLFGASNEPKH